MPPVKLGDIVLYVLPGTTEHGTAAPRPAIVVYVWPDGTTVGLQVFTDGTNDGPAFRSGIYWANPVAYNDTSQPVNTWHFRA